MHRAKRTDRGWAKQATKVVLWLLGSLIIAALPGRGYGQGQSSDKLTFYSGWRTVTRTDADAACKMLNKFDGDGMRAGYDRASDDWVCTAAEVAYRTGGRAICRASTTGRTFRDFATTTVWSKGNPELLCLSAPVDLSCATPTTDVPDWPNPTFAGSMDDRCDTYVRGPVPAPPSSRPDANGAFKESSALVEPLLTFEIPQLFNPLFVGLLTDARGQLLRPPGVPLRRLISGHPTIAVEWRDACALCEKVLNVLHNDGMRTLLSPKLATDHREAQLLILYDRTTDTERDLTTLARLRQKFPGRAVLATDGMNVYSRSGTEAPRVWLIDRHGLLRASTFGRRIEQARDGLELLQEPSLFLDVALRNAVWAQPPREASLNDVAKELTAGRLPATVADAPSTIVLPQLLQRQMLEAAVRTRQTGNEHAGAMVLDAAGLRLVGLREGKTISSQPDYQVLNEELRRSPDAKRVGTFHTHPANGPFSASDSFQAGFAKELAIVEMTGGTFMLSVPTLEGLRANRPVNPDLAGRRDLAIRYAEARVDFLGPTEQLLRPTDIPPNLPQPLLDWIVRTAPAHEQIVNAVNLTKIAAAKGIALYVGQGAVLQNFSVALEPVGAGYANAAWPGDRAAELTPIEKVALSRILRAMNGDKNAFCELREEDIGTANTFNSAAQEMIKNLPNAQRKQVPNEPPTLALRRGQLTEQDFVALIELADGIVTFEEGRIMHRQNRGCIMQYASNAVVAGDPKRRADIETTASVELLAGEAKKDVEDVSESTRSYRVDPMRRVDAASFGPRLNDPCRKARIVRWRDGKKSETACVDR